VHRDADRAGLVRNPTLDRLADPPRGVGRELVAAAVVELLGGADQAEHAVLDQVQEGQALALVVLRDRDHEPQVRADHAVLGVMIAALDPFGELHLFLRGQQAMPSDLVQELAERLRF
jgi:hypothetical protein